MVTGNSTLIGPRLQIYPVQRTPSKSLSKHAVRGAGSYSAVYIFLTDETELRKKIREHPGNP